MSIGASRPLLEGAGLVRCYDDGAGEVAALRGVDVELGAGEFVALTGPSGSGKSTLVHLLSGLDRPTAGRVMVEGREIGGLGDRELALLRRRRFGYVLQFFNLLPSLSALENVAFPLMLDRARGADRRARAALDAVGLATRATHRPSQLSGGEQQRVALARALVTRPAVVFADEPTGNLDQAAGARILELLRAAADDGQAIAMATHDPRTAEYADRVVELVDGALRPRR